MTDEKRIELLPCPVCRNPLKADVTLIHRQPCLICFNDDCPLDSLELETEKLLAHTRATPKPTEAGATSRTDDASFYAYSDGDNSKRMCVSASVSRQLERDLNEAKADTENAKSISSANWDEVLDHERWLKEMCEDYRLDYDPHKVSMRCAINELIHRQRDQLTAAQNEIEELKRAVSEHHNAKYHNEGSAMFDAEHGTNCLACAVIAQSKGHL